MSVPSRLALIAVVALLVAACAPAGAHTWTYRPGSATEPPTASSPAPTDPPSAGPTVEPGASPPAGNGLAGTLTIRARDVHFEPSSLTVAAPGRYEVVLINEGVVEHDVTFVDGTHIHAAAGETAVGLVDIPAAGLDFICSVVGHADAGMRGSVTVSADTPGGQEPGGHSPGGQEPPPTMSAEEMRDIDAARTALFPAATEGKGGVLLEPVIGEDGVKQWELTASAFDWETEPGVLVKAMGYNGMVPGPELRAELGDRVRVILHNELEEPTTIHFHGLLVPNAMDGVPVINQPAVMPGESFTYEFEVRNSGSHMYHSHFMAAHQVPMGMLGAFIVDEPAEPRAEVDYVMVLNDGPLGYTLNGKSFPATEPIVAQSGQTVRIRYMNEGFQIHPMHLHGMPQRIVARDGYALDQPYFQDTVLVSPGERVDVIVEATEPGAWAFHCHVLSHAEGDEGMFGMVTALIVEEPGAP